VATELPNRVWGTFSGHSLGKPGLREEETE
jgi:hypothetical protein